MGWLSKNKKNMTYGARQVGGGWKSWCTCCWEPHLCRFMQAYASLCKSAAIGNPGLPCIVILMLGKTGHVYVKMGKRVAMGNCGLQVMR